MIKFEHITGFSVNLPKRGSKYSAGYDIESARTLVVPSLFQQIKNLRHHLDEETYACMIAYYDNIGNIKTHKDFTEMKRCVRRLNLVTMVPTGLKCKMENDMYLELHPRSSTGCMLLQLANQTGIIDSDYYNNKDNGGHIYVPLVNLTPYDIQIKKGDKIAQGIFRRYITTDDDIFVNNKDLEGKRAGGFGSTGR